MAEVREPLGPSMAYAMSAGVGRGKSIAGSEVSSHSLPVSAGRGVALQYTAMNERRRQELENAQRPYEQYLVIVMSD